MKLLLQRKIFLHTVFYILCIINLHCGNNESNISPIPEPLPTVVPGNDDLDKLNYMRLSDGKFRIEQPKDHVPITSRADLSNTFDAIEKKENSLVIYFHGGFIPIQESYTDPKKIGLDGVIRKGKCFPFYVLYGGGLGNVIWSTVTNEFQCEKEPNDSYVETVDNSLDSAFATAIKLKSIQYLMVQFNRKYAYVGEDALTIQASKTIYREIKDTANLETVFRNELEQQDDKDLIRNDFLNDKKIQEEFEQDLIGDTILQDLCRKEAKLQQGFAPEKEKIINGNFLISFYDVSKIIATISYRFIKRRGHGVRMTIFEEIFLNSSNGIIKGIRLAAQCVWGKSKQQVIDAFNPDGIAYGGTALLDELVRVNSDRSAKKQVPLKIFLVGSSTGTIMICHLLQAASKEKYKNLNFNVIFSVPSCTMELFAQTLSKAEKQISSFYMFALSDSVEKRAANVPFFELFYPGTILYAVSGLVETKNNKFHDAPLVGMQRFYQPGFLENKKNKFHKNEKNNIEKVIQFLDGKNKKIIWSQEVSDDGNLSNNGTAHKKVIRDSAVQSSILYLLTH